MSLFRHRLQSGPVVPEGNVVIDGSLRFRYAYKRLNPEPAGHLSGGQVPVIPQDGGVLRMTRRILALWMILVLAICMVSVSGSAEAPSGPLFSDTMFMNSEKNGRGFSYPLVRNRTMKRSVNRFYDSTYVIAEESQDGSLFVTYSIAVLDDFMTDEALTAFFRETAGNTRNAKYNREAVDFAEKEIEVNGYRALLITYRRGGRYEGEIYFVAENTSLYIGPEWSPADAGQDGRKMTMEDLEVFARQVVFNPENAPIRKADGDLTIAQKDNLQTLIAGKKAVFTGKFANAPAVKSSDMDAIRWSVTDSATGEAVEGITISDKGVLTTDKQLTELYHVVIHVTSDVFGTEAEYPLTIIPILKKLTADPTELILSLSSPEGITVKVSPEPAPVPVNLKWTIRPAKIAEVVPGENGTAVIKPLTKGKGTLTVKDTGTGKIVRINIKVIQEEE